MVDLGVKIGSITLPNPVMPGSGTFGEGLARVFDLNLLGAIVTKTITDDVREGNPPPRVAEFRDATLFSIGIPSKGSDYYIHETVPFFRRYTPPLIASISANSVEEFGALAGKIAVQGVAAIEANVSCPNLKKDGQAFGMDADATYQVVQAMRECSGLPIWAKMTPNAGNVAQIAQAAEAAGAEAIVMGNAMLAMAIDTETFMPKVANLMGGLTGRATKPILLRMAYQCAQSVRIPVIGCGGIATASDAIEYMLSGCTAVQVGTENFLHPGVMPRMIEDIRDFCIRRGFTHVNDLIGAMQTHEPVSMAWRASL